MYILGDAEKNLFDHEARWPHHTVKASDGELYTITSVWDRCDTLDWLSEGEHFMATSDEDVFVSSITGIVAIFQGGNDD